MLTESEATKLVEGAFPDSRIELPIEYNEFFIFPVYGPDPFEGSHDPFRSVNRRTGEIRDFSILVDGDIHEIGAKFLEKQGGKIEEV